MGGGRTLKIQQKSRAHHLNLCALGKNLRNSFLKQTKGAILVEFAFCISVFIIIIFYVYDLCLLKRVNSYMKSAACYAVNMLQNVSQNRSNKQLTRTDIENIARAWVLTLPISLDFIAGKTKNELLLVTAITLVKGTEVNKCKVLWHSYIDFKKFPNIDRYNANNQSGKPITGAHACSLNSRYRVTAKIGQEVDTHNLYSDLHINPNEIKAILELSMYNNSGMKKVITIEKAFGFLLINLPSYKNLKDTYFNTHVIFTPKFGLFSETEPPK